MKSLFPVRAHVLKAALLFGLSFWVIDAVLDYLVFYQGRGGFWDLLVLHVPPHELWVRSYVLAACLAGGFLLWRVQDQRMRSETRYRRLVETMHDGLFLLDQEGRIGYANPRLSEITGYDPEELLGMHYSRLVPEERREEVAKRIWAGGPGSRQEEMELVRKDGGRARVLCSAKLHRDDSGFSKGSFVVLSDVTERNQLESQLRHAQKMEAIGALAGGIAHDFNNLLQGIHGYAELMLMGRSENDPDGRHLREIAKTARKGSDLTRQLLTFSRKLESRLRPVDLNQEIQHIRSLLERALTKSISVHFHPGMDLRIIYADPNQVEQVVMNLALNARDAMPEGGDLIIETWNVSLDDEYCRTHVDALPGDFVVLAMSDTGHGMDKRVRERIFEPFFTTKAVGKGSGLGLSMVYGIVKNHGGLINCYSEPGTGTTFKVYWPTVLQIRRGEEEVPGMKELPRGSESVLLADDEEAVRDFAEQVLLRQGYTVTSAPDGETALALYKENPTGYALVILDLIMPGMGGMKCLQEIRKIHPEQKVILTSGYSANGAVAGGFKEGAKAFLNKPYEIREMLKMIRMVLDQS